MTIKDFFVNWFLRIRYFFIRNFRSHLIKTESPLLKGNKNLLVTFYDNFTTNSWEGDRRKWDVGESWGKVNPDRYNVYMSHPETCAFFKDGEMHKCAKFFARYNPKWHSIQGIERLVPFEVSWLSSHNFHRQKYGRWECRMTLPEGKATWPAFWTWNKTWPPEIDIIEAYGRSKGKIRSQYIQLHWGKTEDGTKSKMFRAWRVKLPNKGDDFHEFAMEWTPTSIMFYTNNVKVFQFTNKRVLNQYFNFHGDHRMLVNHNLKNDGKSGTKYLTEQEAKNYESHFYVDYVRAYKFNSDLLK